MQGLAGPTGCKVARTGRWSAKRAATNPRQTDATARGRLLTGGASCKGYDAVREQSRRLSLCCLTFYRISEGGEAVVNGGFVREAILPGQGVGVQPSLWRETVVLDEVFYESLIRHPLPVREAAIRALAGRSMAVDFLIWLSYRLHGVTT